MASKNIQDLLRYTVTGGLRERATPYAISLDVGKELGRDPKELIRVQARWYRWLSGQCLNTVNIIAEDLDRLGYQFAIVEKTEEPDDPS